MFKSYLAVLAVLVCSSHLLAGEPVESGVISVGELKSKAGVSVLDLECPLKLEKAIQVNPAFMNSDFNVFGYEFDQKENVNGVSSLSLTLWRMPVGHFFPDADGAENLATLLISRVHVGETIPTPFGCDWRFRQVQRDVHFGDYIAEFFVMRTRPKKEFESSKEVRVPFASTVFLKGGRVERTNGKHQCWINLSCEYDFLDEEKTIRKEDQGLPVLNLSYSSEMLVGDKKIENNQKTLQHIHVGDEFKLLGERSYRISKIVFDDPQTKRRGWIEIEPGSGKLAMDARDIVR